MSARQRIIMSDSDKESDASHEPPEPPPAKRRKDVAGLDPKKAVAARSRVTAKRKGSEGKAAAQPAGVQSANRNMPKEEVISVSRAVALLELRGANKGMEKPLEKSMRTDLLDALKDGKPESLPKMRELVTLMARQDAESSVFIQAGIDLSCYTDLKTLARSAGAAKRFFNYYDRSKTPEAMEKAKNLLSSNQQPLVLASAQWADDDEDSTTAAAWLALDKVIAQMQKRKALKQPASIHAVAHAQQFREEFDGQLCESKLRQDKLAAAQ